MHATTKAEMIAKSKEHGVHIIQTVQGLYRAYYKGCMLAASPAHDFCVKQALRVAQAHVDAHGGGSCDVFDYSSVPMA